MKKILAIILALLFATSGVAFAENKPVVTSIETTSAVTTNVDVASLQEQIQNLLAQIVALQAQLQAVQTEVVQLRIAFNSYLKPGVENEEVRQLQEVLAKDKNIYPEGLVTGYYGTLTEKAVKKFQEKHGIEAEGVVGPKTRAKLNALYSNDEYKKKEYYENKKKEEYVEDSAKKTEEEKSEEYYEDKKEEQYIEEEKEAQYAPEIEFSVTPNSIVSGESVELSWSSSNATICYAHENWSGTLGLSGSEKLYPTEDITYAIKCKGDYGKTIEYAGVIVE